MKELLKKMLYLDENTGKFSTSKFMTLLYFYFIIFLSARSLYLDREIKNVAFVQETFLGLSVLYFGRRMSFETKNFKMGGRSENKEESEK